MKILVQGPGAIGLLLAVRLAAAGRQVTLLDRDAERAKRSADERFVVEDGPDGSGQESAELSSLWVSGEAGRGEFDLLVVCVKAYDLEEALEKGVSFLSREGELLVLVNGLGGPDAANRWHAAERSFVGSIDYGALRLDGKRVRQTGHGRIRIGSCAKEVAGLERARELATLLVDSGFEATAEEDIGRVVWEKAIVNCAINPVAALARVPNGALLVGPAREILRGIVDEVVAVIVAGSEENEPGWLEADVLRRVHDVCERTAANRCSMLRDIEEGRRTEIDALNGRVVALGEALGIRLPLNQALVHLVKTAEKAGISGC